ALMALLDVELGLTDREADEVELGGVVEILDREDGLEHGLEADVLALIACEVLLQKLVVRSPLDLDEIGDLDDLLDLSEVATWTEIVRNLRHLGSSPIQFCPRAALDPGTPLPDLRSSDGPRDAARARIARDFDFVPV